MRPALSCQHFWLQYSKALVRSATLLLVQKPSNNSLRLIYFVDHNGVAKRTAEGLTQAFLGRTDQFDQKLPARSLEPVKGSHDLLGAKSLVADSPPTPPSIPPVSLGSNWSVVPQSWLFCILLAPTRQVPLRPGRVQVLPPSPNEALAVRSGRNAGRSGTPHGTGTSRPLPAAPIVRHQDGCWSGAFFISRE